MMSTGDVDLPALLGRFHASHPGVAVHPGSRPPGFAELARQVIVGEFDLAVASPARPAACGPAAAGE
jgi:DNA-binding transcriptional LysR family regulator